MSALTRSACIAALLVGSLGETPERQRPAAPLWPSGRAGHVMTYDPLRGQTVLLGGDTDQRTQTRDSLWAWSGTSWRVSGAPGPTWRTLPGAAFDTRRGRLVLFGGLRKVSAQEYGSTESDTWERDGTRWEQRSVVSPGPMDHHAMVYDEARGVMLVQGGGANSKLLSGETWTYDGTKWTMVADSSAGSGRRAHHAMAYDSRRQRVVLFGGGTQAETWEWDGRRWERIASPGPNPRGGIRLAYDAARGATVMYGTDTDTTWTWDGVRWTAASTSGPPPRTLSAMAYDARRGRVVLYGGGSRRSDLWEWDGARWEQRQ